MFSFQSRICMYLWTKPQNEKARGMATLKSISIRLKSVKNIQKITQSMKMVSAAKYARAERELKQVIPLGRFFTSFYKRTESEKTQEGKTEEKPSSSKKILYLAVTSDRGLCGAVHTSVAKIIRNTLTDPGDNIKIVCIGDKARTLLQRLYSANILLVCQEVGRLPATFQDASAIAKDILKSEFQFETVKIIFNRYRSVVSYATEEIRMYSYDTVLDSPEIKKYDEVNEENLLPFIEFSLASLIFYAMKEGACSEQSSRMTAMDNASKNAGEMISKLTLTFNRTRQAVITRELIEIISGASAL